MGPAQQQKPLHIIAAVGASILLLSLIINVYLVWKNRDLYRETQRKAVRLSSIEGQMRDWQQFMMELVEYSRKQPALDPVLQKYMIKQSTPTTKPR